MNVSGAILSALPLGLATGLHCVGMCGSLILAVGGASSADGSRLRRALPHASYHLGRALTYAAIGAAVGAFGTALARWGAMIGFHQLAMAVSIGVLVMVGLHLARALPLPGGGAGGRAAAGLGRALGLAAGVPGAFTLGAMTGFLPCMPLYAGFGVAMAAGSPLGGMAAMLLFWAGTLPPLLALGFTSSFFLARLRQRTGAIIAMVILSAAIAILGLKMARAGNAAGGACHCHHGAPAGAMHQIPPLP
jgi:uncharacterized protein